MIKGSTLVATVPDIEEMFVVGVAAPGGDMFTSYVKRADLTVEQQAVYNDGVNLVSGNYYTEISNTTSTLTIDRVTSEANAEGTNSFDFDVMSEVDKDKLRALLALFVELKD